MGQPVTFVRSLMVALSAIVCLWASPASVSAQASGSEYGPVRLDAALRLEGGYNTNVFRATDDAGRSGALQLNINPRLRASTVSPGLVAFNSGVSFVWSQFVGNADLRRQSAEAVNADIELRFNPNGLVSVAPRDTLRRSSRASFGPAGRPFKSTENTFELEVALHPGGANRSSRLGLSGSLTGFHQLWRYDRFPTLDKNGFGGRLELKYNFLPKTAVFLNAMVMTILNESNEIRQAQDLETGTNFTRANPDSTPIRLSAGLTGLLLPRLGLLVSAGYGRTAYRGPGSFTFGQPIIQVRLDGYLTQRSTVYGDYQYNFADGVVEDAYRYHRAAVGTDVNAGLLSTGAEIAYQRSRFETAVAQFNDCENNERLDSSVEGTAELGLNPNRFFSTGARYTVEYRDSTCRQTSLETGASGLAAPGDAGFVTHGIFLFLEVSN